jgi:hypothetical protein
VVLFGAFELHSPTSEQRNAEKLCDVALKQGNQYPFCPLTEAAIGSRGRLVPYARRSIEPYCFSTSALYSPG